MSEYRKELELALDETTPPDRLRELFRCPTCSSPHPSKHPAMQFEGEVQLCEDEWHAPSASLVRAKGQLDEAEKS